MTVALSRPLTIKSTPFDRLVAGLRAARVLALDPNRLDQVLILLEAVNIGTLKARLVELDALSEARALLRDQPRIDAQSIDFGALERLPEGTLGREYVRFLHANGITPEAFEKLPELGDPRLSYLVMRLRQTHDLWHVVTGYSADVRGELLLQAFTYAQLRAPGSALIAVLGSLRFGWKFERHAREIWRAYRRGKAAHPFAMFAWERHLEMPVVQVRQLLGCVGEPDRADAQGVLAPGRPLRDRAHRGDHEGGSSASKGSATRAIPTAGLSM